MVAIKNVRPCFSHIHFALCSTHFFVKLFEILLCEYFDIAQFIGNSVITIFITKFSSKCKKWKYFDFDYVFGLEFIAENLIWLANSNYKWLFYYMNICGPWVQRSIMFCNFLSYTYKITKNWQDHQGQVSLLFHVYLYALYLTLRMRCLNKVSPIKQ